MRVTKIAIVTFLLSCGVFTGLTRGVEIIPSNIFPSYDFVDDELVLSSAGDVFSFDLVMSGITAPIAQAVSYKSTISLSGPSILSLDVANSEAVESDPDYWLFGNSSSSFAQDNTDIYVFSDGPDDPPVEPLDTGDIGDIMARYAFEWDGTIGDYTFALVPGTANSKVTDISFGTHELQLDPGPYQGGSFTLHIVPEPTTLMLIGFGSLVLLRKRRA